MSNIARRWSTPPGAAPPWSPSPSAVIVGAAWVLLGAGVHLVASHPVALLVVAVAALLGASVAGARSSHGDGGGRRAGRTIDLDARLEREAGRR